MSEYRSKQIFIITNTIVQWGISLYFFLEKKIASLFFNFCTYHRDYNSTFFVFMSCFSANVI